MAVFQQSGTVSDANDLLMMRRSTRPAMISKVNLKILMGMSSGMGEVLFGNDKMTRLRCSMVMGAIVKAPAFTRGSRVWRGGRPD